jgi:hypothetical protein
MTAMITQPIDSSTKPPRTWRPMLLWTLAILLVLGLVWFVTGVVVPAVGTNRILRELDSRRTKVEPCPIWDRETEAGALERLGGAEKAFARLRIYRALPASIATHQQAALRLIGLCGGRALPVLRRALSSPDGAEVLLALNILQERFGGWAELGTLAPVLTRLLDTDRTEEPWPEVPRKAGWTIAWTGPANVVFRAEGEAAEVLDSKLVKVQTATELAAFPMGSFCSEAGAREHQRTVSGDKALHFECMMRNPVTDKPLARLRLVVPEDGSYYIFLRGAAWCCGCQVLEFRIDDGAKQTVSELWFDNLDWRSLFQGRRAGEPDDIIPSCPAPVWLSAGEHSLAIIRAEPICTGMIIDELAVVRSSRAPVPKEPVRIRGEEPK